MFFQDLLATILVRHKVNVEATETKGSVFGRRGVPDIDSIDESIFVDLNKLLL